MKNLTMSEISTKFMDVCYKDKVLGNLTDIKEITNNMKF